MEYYARKAKVAASCHQLRQTMATQMLNADAQMVCIQRTLTETYGWGWGSFQCRLKSRISSTGA